MQVSYNIQGDKEVERVFRNLPRSTQNKAMRPALRVGAEVVRDAASANVKAITSSESTGLLARSLRVYSFKKLRGMLRVAVMVRRGLVTRKGVRVGLYAAVLEYGKAGQPPRSWIRKAAREKQGAAFNAIANEAERRMAAALEDAKR